MPDSASSSVFKLKGAAEEGRPWDEMSERRPPRMVPPVVGGNKRFGVDLTLVGDWGSSGALSFAEERMLAGKADCGGAVRRFC